MAEILLIQETNWILLVILVTQHNIQLNPRWCLGSLVNIKYASEAWFWLIFYVDLTAQHQLGLSVCYINVIQNKIFGGHSSSFPHMQTANLCFSGFPGLISTLTIAPFMPSVKLFPSRLYHADSGLIKSALWGNKLNFYFFQFCTIPQKVSHGVLLSVMRSIKYGKFHTLEPSLKCKM